MLFKNPFFLSSYFGKKERNVLAKWLVIGVAILYVLRLFQLQVLDYLIFKNKAERQVVKQKIVYPERGNMYDRNGNLIVSNMISMSICIVPAEYVDFTINSTKRTDSIETPLLMYVLQGDSNEIINKLDEIYEKVNDTTQKRYSKFSQYVIVRDVDAETLARYEEVSSYLPGVYIQMDTKRLYEANCNMAHLLGYVREVTADQIKGQYQYMKPGEMVGIGGLEQTYETFLHGRNGLEYYYTDKYGRRVDDISMSNKIQPNAGFNLNLSIDIKMQELAERLLTGKRGAVVAIDPNNGEILTCASKPDYDPKLFAGKVPVDIYSALANDKSHPLLSRALQAQYPPGSTWKMLIALAGLQEGVINEGSYIACNGGFSLGGRTWKCHGCGSVNVRSAIRSSCNTFFCTVCVRLGMDKFVKYGQMFNFGMKTQVDLPDEHKGRLPTKEYLLKADKTIVSFAGRLANYGIGQGEILTTPMQLAAYVATIANGGTYYQPHIVRSIFNTYNKKTEYLHFDSKQLPIQKRYFDIVKRGMWDVVNAGGTGSGVAIYGLNVCGKTGTAQNSAGADHSWFVCFAPRDNPKIAMCVLVENAGYGAAVAAPIARRLIYQYFYPNSGGEPSGTDTNAVDSVPKIQDIEIFAPVEE